MHAISKIVVIGLALLMMPSAGTCLAEEKRELVIGVQDNSISLDPAISYELIGWGIIDKVYETLVGFQASDYTQPVPLLAESWELGMDGRTWTFHLRKDAVFASGNPVNADAVVFSLRRLLRLAAEASWILLQFKLTEESITKIDAYTVQIVLEQHYAPNVFLACLAVPIASILDHQVVMAHEQHGDEGRAWLYNHSAGSGAYVIEAREWGEQIILKRNARYWGKMPAFDRVMIKNISDPFEQIHLLLQKEIDIAWELQPEHVQVLTTHPDIHIFEALTFRLIYINMNLRYEPLAKPEIRDTVRYAIDYEGLIEYILGGTAIKIQTFIPKGLLGYNPATPYNTDLKKAKHLLVDAGYPDGFEVDLTCFDFSPWLDIAIKIKADLARIGIRVNIHPLPVNEVFYRLRTQEHQLLLSHWLPDYLDPDANAKPFADSRSRLLVFENGYMNQEASELVEQAAQELDQERRKELYKKVTEIILNDGPFVILCSPIHQYGIRTEVADVVKPMLHAWFQLPEL